MPSRIKPQDAQRYIASVQEKLDRIADGRSAVKVSEIKDDPVLMDLARDVFSGCGAMPQASVRKMKAALESIGATMKTIDKDQDGVVDYSEAARLSPLALRMLDLAAERGPEPSPPSSDDDAVAPAPAPVSSGCGSASTTPSPPPAPARPVASGC